MASQQEIFNIRERHQKVAHVIGNPAQTLLAKVLTEDIDTLLEYVTELEHLGPRAA